MKHDISFVHRVGDVLVRANGPQEAARIINQESNELSAALSGNQLIVSRISYLKGKPVRIAVVTY